MDALRFDRFELRPAQRQLLADGEPLELGARALDLLVVLVEHAGQLVTKDTLLDRVWPDVIVEEANLHVQVSTLRRLLGRDAIATVPGRGYQFVRPLRVSPAAPPSAPAAAPGLPVLHGREAELAQAQALLEAGRLLTITGAGGGGKTLLARHLMQRLQAWRPQGAAWVDLLELADADAMPAAVSAALGFDSGPTTVPALASALRADDRLLVLDNAEHLLEPVRVLVSALLDAAPALRLIVTSQAPLRLPGEQRLTLRGLPVPAAACPADTARRSPAVALFAERARQVERRFRLDDTTVGDVIAIAHALDGSALGLQLAASLLALQPLAELRRRLAPEVPAGMDAAAVPADNVLRAALGWSHELLDEAPRRVFRRLAVPLGPLPLTLVQPMAGDDTLDATAVADALAELVDRSLVDAETDGPEPRYRLLESPRALALECLQAAGEATAVQARLARALGAQALSAWADGSPGQRSTNERVAAADIRSALRWALVHDLAIAAVLAPSPPCHQRPADERLAWAEQLAQGAPGLPPRAAGDALLAAAVLTRHSDLRRRHGLMLQAATHYAEAGAICDRYYALARAAEAAAVHRLLDEAEAPLAQARALEDPAWPASLRVVRAEAEAAILSARSDLELARQAWLRALELGRQAGPPALSALNGLADIELQLGRFGDAAAHLEEAAAVALRQGQHGDRWCFILANLTAARLMQGDLAGARRVATEAWPQVRELDADAWWADHLALLAALEGRPRHAALLLGLADAAYRRIRDGRHELETRNAEHAARLSRAALGDAGFDALRAAGAEPGRDAELRHAALQTQDAPGA